MYLLDVYSSVLPQYYRVYTAADHKTSLTEYYTLFTDVYTYIYIIINSMIAYSSTFLLYVLSLCNMYAAYIATEYMKYTVVHRVIIQREHTLFVYIL